MNIPGFTAEAAMPEGRYRVAVDRGGAISSGQVQPQACVNIGPCKVCVDYKLWPPKACLSFSCLGFNKSFCVP